MQGSVFTDGHARVLPRTRCTWAAWWPNGASEEHITMELPLSSSADDGSGIYINACFSSPRGNILVGREEEAWGRTGTGCLLQGDGVRQPVVPATRVGVAAPEDHGRKACLHYKRTLRLAGAT